MSYPPVPHDVKCLVQVANAVINQVAWETRWPNHCTACMGEGGVSHPGTLQCPPEWFPCAYCLEQGVCPRCGRQSWGGDDDLTRPCQHCAWDPGNPDYRPPDPAPCACLIRRETAEELLMAVMDRRKMSVKDQDALLLKLEQALWKDGVETLTPSEVHQLVLGRSPGPVPTVAAILERS